MLRRKLLYFAPLFAFSIFLMVSCSESKSILSCETFHELADPAKKDTIAWSKIEDGLNIAIGSPDVLYPKSSIPHVDKKDIVKLTAWKNERVSAQLILWSKEDINGIECTISDLKNGTSALPSSIAQARFVRYVMTDEFADGCGHRKPEDFASSLSPDMLDTLKCFDLESMSTRPVWLSFKIPSGATFGIYNGTVEIKVKGKTKQKFPVELEVVDALLPDPSDWAYHLDLWQHPTAVARTQNLEIWSKEHFDALRPVMKMLAEAGQKVITVNINKDPWNNQCYDAYSEMIKWTKLRDGQWKYDFTVFDKWVQFMMDLGIKKQINCYSMLPWNNELIYTDEATNKVITISPKPGSKEFNDVWTSFLSVFKSHLNEKKWLEITNIAMDERSPEDMKHTVSLLNKVAPELGIALADNHKSYKRYPDIKDMSVSISATVDSADIKYRREKRLVTTYYVCCADKFPNMFTFSEPLEGIYAAWFAIAMDYDGLLRWAYNSWTEKPLTDSRFRTWPAGDTYIVYPNARSSIRFEKLVEGIQDAEKIRIIREKLTKQSSEDKLGELNRIISRFNTDKPDSKWRDELINARKMLNSVIK
jgi:hypothetical protein